MRNATGRMIRRCSLTSVLLAGLALLPSFAWAARDEQKTDRNADKPQAQAQQAARGRPVPAQLPAPSRATVPQQQPKSATPAVPASVWVNRGSAAGRVPASMPSQTPAARPDPSAKPRVVAPQAGSDSQWAPAPNQQQDSRPDRPGVQQNRPRTQPAPVSRDPLPVLRVPERAKVQLDRPVRVKPVAPAPAAESRERTPSVVRSPQAPVRPPVQSPAVVRKSHNEPRPAVTRPAAPDKSGTAGRRLVVPEASFRGPGNESKVRTVAPDQAKLAPARLRNWVREQSSQWGRPDNARPAVDAVGNPVPADAWLLNRNATTGITINYTKVVNHVGSPGFSYVVVPGAVWGGGYFRQAHRQHSVVVINLFYPFYYSDPQFVGFFYPGYYPSVYAYFGWAPGWVYPQRVYHAPADYVYLADLPHRYYGVSYRLDSVGAARAIRDIRNSWLQGDTGALAAHLTDQLDVRIYFDGEYSYTTSVDDFYAMTLDTLATTRTLAMDLDEPLWISSEEVFCTGYQVFEDPYGEQHTVYVSYRFRKLGAEWYLVALGTSRNPIEHRYTDFRYRDN